MMSNCRRHSLDGHALKAALATATERFQHDVEIINAMNVFPVPDGDTGTNMRHTLQRAYQEIADLNCDSAAHIAQQFAHGALMGARGNSGTFFSQLCKGFANGLAASPVLDVPRLVHACKCAAHLAYLAVEDPVEGTILTVARQAAATLESRKHELHTLDQAMTTLLDAATVSLRNTPNLLPILREAGVVDAGAMALVSFLRGMSPTDQHALELELPPPMLAEPTIDSSEHDDYGYDVQFLMLAENLSIDQIRRDLAAMGSSLLVVGNDSTVKVHIHVDNPALPIDYAIHAGVQLDDVVVENMRLQSMPNQPQPPPTTDSATAHNPPDPAIIAVAQGSGLHALLREWKCTDILPGGQSDNPSVEDFLAAIKRASSPRIIILPNNRNIVMTARQAANLTEQPDVRVLPTHSIPQAISALIAATNAINANSDLDSIIADMTTAAEQTRTIEITRATRDALIHDLAIKAGDYLALVDGHAQAAATSLEQCLVAAFDSINTSEYELATLYYGLDLSEEEALDLIERLSSAHPALAFEQVFGGQPLYQCLIGLE